MGNIHKKWGTTNKQLGINKCSEDENVYIMMTTIIIILENMKQKHKKEK